jgi:glycosyltransferase involved in cell wall biosynthesis
MKVFCLIAVRNEERYLPGFLHHMRDAVDGIIALDDCSTDGTPAILRGEPRVVSILTEDRAGPPHANETSNRHRLLVEAARLGAEWVVCADADERFEARFLDRLHAEAEEGERTSRLIRCVRIVNLWNSPQHFRADGRNGPRWTPRMFKLPSRLPERSPVLHRPWFPMELDTAPKTYVNAYLFHLRMIDRSERQARFRKFRLIDPQNSHQRIGYQHLIDETNLTLRPVLPWRTYVDLAPSDLPTKRPDVSLPDQAEFDEMFYLCRYLDVQRAIAQGRCASGWQHFKRHGLDEGRVWRRRAQLSGLDFDAIFRKRRIGVR